MIPSRLPKTAHLFKQLYDLDIVDEDAFMKWAKKPSKKNVGSELAMEIHAKAKPFIDWLATAEEESSDDDGTEFTNEPETTTTATATGSTGADEDENEDEEDVDLDDL